MERKVLIRDIFNVSGRIDLQLDLAAGRRGIDREIRYGDINRPGLTLAGYMEHFSPDRIQIFGLGETSFLKQQTERERKDIYERFFSFPVLCCVFTHGVAPDDDFRAVADKKDIPVYVSRWGTTRFTSLIVHVMDEAFSPRINMHGTLVDVFGLGVLLLGKSSVGKSECALELVERGHRLVADDMVVINKIDESLLMGSGSPILRHHMEIRGIGIINIRDLFGIRSIRNRKRIELVALLEEWDNTKEYDRLGLEETHYTIMDIEIPYNVVPVRPGRNIPIILETAALNQRLKKLGVFSARELDTRVQNWINTQKDSND